MEGLVLLPVIGCCQNVAWRPWYPLSGHGLWGLLCRPAMGSVQDTLSDWYASSMVQ